MSEKSFQARFMAALAEMPNPTKDNKATVPTKNGRSYSYTYEDLASLIAIIKPVLAKHGLAFRQGVAEIGPDLLLNTFVFDDTEERLMDQRPLTVDGDAQAAGSYETYMRRYALKTVFGLAGEDDDGAATKQDHKQHDPQQQWKLLCDQITAHKAEAISLGVIEDAMKAKITLMLKGKAFKDASVADLAAIDSYIEGLILDKKELNGGDQ